MADFRWDPVNGEWVIIAKNRAQRPNEFQMSVDRTRISDCPFCRGNEDQTPKEIAVYPKDQPGNRWHTRVFANKYPAVDFEAGNDGLANVGPYRQGDCVGHHEIVVESPDHKTTFSQLTDDEADSAFQAYRDRVSHFAEDSRLKHASIFKNCRPAAGASIEHLHSQILCTSVVSETVLRRVARAKQYWLANGKDGISSIAEYEKEQQTRVVLESRNYLALCPYASRFGYLANILPQKKMPDFFILPDEELCELARLVRRVVMKLESCLPEVAYNILFHLPPFGMDTGDYYPWHLEIFPRLSHAAGYELGSGCWINPVSPEDAAESMRNAE